MENEWIIYTKNNCINCALVKELLYVEDVKYIYCDNFINNEYNKLHFLQSMKNKIGYCYNTFPMVFHKDKFIGGYNDCKEYYKNITFTIDDDF